MQNEPQLIHLSTDWLVINKPASCLTIPDRSLSGSVVEWAREKVGEVWVIHRLDRDTTGVLLFARSQQAHVLANEWFRKREMKKTYSFLSQFPTAVSSSDLASGSQGSFTWPPTWKVNRPIAGAPSTTQFEILETFQHFFYGQAFPKTGRRHQIRIHLSEEGFPILGDLSYGGFSEVVHKNEKMKIPRCLLHASSLALPTGEVFRAPLPEDFQRVLNFFQRRGE